MVDVYDFLFDWIEIEVIENVVFCNFEENIEVFEYVWVLGCKIVFDDFGLGYFLFLLFEELLFDKVKFDKSL